MTKKTYPNGLLLLGLLSIFLWGMPRAYADSGGATSSVEIRIIGNQEAVKPLNPLLPEDAEPGVPDGSPSGSTAELSIDFISDIHLGSQKITSEDRLYEAEPQIFRLADQVVKRPNFIQISDLRGTFAGWTLKVAQLHQFTSKKQAQSLKGANLSFKNGNLVSTTSSRYAPHAISEFSLLPDGTEQIIASADEGKGMGTWLYRLGDLGTMQQSITLAVPGSSIKYADAYQTNLLWKLENTPINQ